MTGLPTLTAMAVATDFHRAFPACVHVAFDRIIIYLISVFVNKVYENLIISSRICAATLLEKRSAGGTRASGRFFKNPSDSRLTSPE